MHNHVTVSDEKGKFQHHLSPPQRPLFVVTRLRRRKRKRAGHDGKGKEIREASAI